MGRCASGSWPGQSQCENPAADDVFCWECWLAVHDETGETSCSCAACAAYENWLNAE